MGICDGRVVIVTGSARGIGREHALAFGRAGARVVVNDLGVELDGSGGGSGPAGELVDEIRKAGGEAIANGADVSSWDETGELVKQTLDAFGRLDVVVNNAGFVRDRMFVSCSEQEWDAPPGGRAHHQYELRGRAPGQRRPELLLGGQGWYRHPDADPGGGAGPLRHHRERHRALGAHTHDRGRLRGHDGQAR
jgi:hypothetical protein